MKGSHYAFAGLDVLERPAAGVAVQMRGGEEPCSDVGCVRRLRICRAGCHGRGCSRGGGANA